MLSDHLLFLKVAGQIYSNFSFFCLPPSVTSDLFCSLPGYLLISHKDKQKGLAEHITS